MLKEPKVHLDMLAEGGMLLSYIIDDYGTLSREMATKVLPEALQAISKRLEDELYEKIKDQFLEKFDETYTEELINKALREKLKLDIFGEK